MHRACYIYAQNETLIILERILKLKESERIESPNSEAEAEAENEKL